jgi:hypothetical protein
MLRLPGMAEATIRGGSFPGASDSATRTQRFTHACSSSTRRAHDRAFHAEPPRLVAGPVGHARLGRDAEPWGITTGLTLWAAQPLQAAGWNLAAQPFWRIEWAREALLGPTLANHASLSDVGLVLGALAAAAWDGGLRHRVPLGSPGALSAVMGGLLMGVGARQSYGCNVGAFIGGVASGSLHGFVWLLAVIQGCWLGIRLRPRFGLPRR